MLLQVGNSGIVAEDCTTLVIWALKLVPFHILAYPSSCLYRYLVAFAVRAKLAVRQIMFVDTSSAREFVTPSTLQWIEHDHIADPASQVNVQFFCAKIRVQLYLPILFRHRRDVVIDELKVSVVSLVRWVHFEFLISTN